ncbi:S8 family serine peptidase [Candidatus Chloroploca asiatica]|uniref:Uncharacterized protein n=1 Tax=Candidatus Chloroploca asiatica TaxID=1506545 RepID=A0A2H3KML2_9CHLR|nr:S8 family serine peptidase [Candidatus Chloroploca asiatica]PDV99350.1 hypothetical protein A9Q02_12680 [Candidatus Chloroploca asiatica]
MKHTLHRIILVLFVLGIALVASTTTVPAASTVSGSGTSNPLTDRVIVRVRDEAGVQAQLAADPTTFADALGTRVQASLTYVRPFDATTHILAVTGVTTQASFDRLLQRLAQDAQVEAVAPDTRVFAQIEPQDPGYQRYGWSFKPVTPENYGANLPPAWTVTTGSPNIVIGIIDTGILLNHEDLAGRQIPGNPGYDVIDDTAVAGDGTGRDADPSDPGDYVTEAEAASGPLEGCDVVNSSWHGSHVAGTIGAQANNDRGPAGVNWVSPMLHVRTLGKCGGYISDVLDGLLWAAGEPVVGLPLNPNPVQVANMSLGGGGTCNSFIQDIINRVVQRGVVVVVAAGNQNRNVSETIPANCSGVISVAATAQSGDRASYSNYGNLITLAAPGGDRRYDSAIYSTINSGLRGPEADAYGFYQGTSMATPHVAGIVSLMLSLNPLLSPAEVRAILDATVTPFPAGSTCIGKCGAGIINAGQAVEAVARQVRRVSFTTEQSSTREGSSVTVTLRLNLPAAEPVIIPLTIGGEAQPDDYTLNPPQALFPAGATETQIVVAARTDTLQEPSETLILGLQSTAQATPSVPMQHTVIIEDVPLDPAITVTPASLAFGDQQVGTTSAPRRVVVQNSGSATLVLQSLEVSGAFQREGGDCPELFPADLAEGSSCSVDLVFLPTRIGLHAGSLAISSNAKEAPTSIALSGRGAVPALGYTPTWLHFAHASDPQLVTITNPGRAPLVINSLTISNTFARLDGSCAATWPDTLAPGAHCTLQITPVVTSATSYSGTLSIASNVPGGPYVIDLTGGELITPTHTAVISTTALSVTDTTVTMEATLQRTEAITAALSVTYRVTGERTDGQGNLVLARGSVTFAPEATEATLRLSFDRFSLYGVRTLLLELGEPALEKDAGTRAQLALLLEEAFVFLPLIR